MKLYAVGIVVLALFTQVADECGRSLSEVEEWAIQLTQMSSPLQNAAGNSSDAVRSVRQATGLREYALSRGNLVKGDGMSFGEIEEAIDKVPGEATLHTIRAAMLIAVGKNEEAEQSKGKALGIHQAVTPEPAANDSNPRVAPGEGNWNYRLQYTASLIRIRGELPANSENVKRVERELCAQYRQGTTYVGAHGVERLLVLPGLNCK